MRILIVNTVGLGYDGITSVICEYLKVIDKKDLDIYIANTIMAEEKIIKTIENCNCTIINLPSRKDKIISYFFKLLSFIKKNHIEVIHVHGNSATMSIELLAAFLGGCKKRIAHAHNTKSDHSKIDRYLRWLFNLLYTDAVACGILAGEFLFKNKKFTVLNNGRNIEKFKYDEAKRQEIRKKFKLGSRLAIGHVGRFDPQKNHTFMIKIFSEIKKQNSNVHFFLIGDGVLKSEIEKEAIESGLDGSISFLGNIDNVNEILQGMDVMILPSLFEGLPLVSIEWQISGLPCLLSDTITRECAITNLVTFCSLDENAENWAKKLLEISHYNNRLEQSIIACKEVKKAGFDILDNAKNLRQIYLGGNNENS